DLQRDVLAFAAVAVRRRRSADLDQLRRDGLHPQLPDPRIRARPGHYGVAVRPARRRARSAWPDHRRPAVGLPYGADGRQGTRLADPCLARYFAVLRHLDFQLARPLQLLPALLDLQPDPDAVAAADLLAVLRSRAAPDARHGQQHLHHR